MREFMIIFIGYFGAYLIPAVYFAATRWQGSARKFFMWGVALQTCGNLAVGGFVYHGWHAGYSEYYWGWALLIPVNMVSALYYLGVSVYAYAQNR